MSTFTIVVINVLLNVVTGKVFVTSVAQNYAGEMNDKLIQQIQKELSASYIYQGYAAYFQRSDVRLSGITKFFSEASLEERQHAQSLIDYINKRGGYAQFDKIDLTGACELVLAHSRQDTSSGMLDFDERRMCICGFVATKTINYACGSRETWKAGLMAFEDAMAIERYVNEELLTIQMEADNKNDVHLAHILEHEFLDEQISSINKLVHYVTRLRSFAQGNYKLGEHIFDQHLS